jgi:flagellar hook-basal body complex protein FliE
MTISNIPTNPALAAYAQAMKRAQSAGDEAPASAAPNFSELLARTVTDAVDASKASEAVSLQAVAGKVDLQDVVEAVNAAEISLQTVVSIRDRVISAYQEIMRMPI